MSHAKGYIYGSVAVYLNKIILRSRQTKRKFFHEKSNRNGDANPVYEINVNNIEE